MLSTKGDVDAKTLLINLRPFGGGGGTRLPETEGD